MNKCIKFFSVFGLVILLIGIGTMTAAVALGADWTGPYRHFEKRVSTVYRIPDTSLWNQEYQSFDASDVTKLELDIGNGDVYIEEDDTLEDEIRVAASHSSSYFEYKTEEGKLKLEYRQRRGDAWRYEYGENQMQIRIPKGFRFDRVEVDMSAGTLWAGNLHAKKMDLEVGAGGIQFTDAVTGELTMEVKAGGISYQGRVDGNVNAECKAGGIEMVLEGEKKDFNYNIECALGFVEIDGESWAGFAGDSTYRNNAAKNMDLECKTGGIEIDFNE